MSQRINVSNQVYSINRTRKKLLPKWTSLTGQFIHPVVRKGMGQQGWIGRIIILVSYKFYFITESMIWENIQVIINPLL